MRNLEEEFKETENLAIKSNQNNDASQTEIKIKIDDEIQEVKENSYDVKSLSKY